jgi:Na+/H+ antiporter NhaA
MATDIAFALESYLMGNRGATVFENILNSIAVIDDLETIMVIAIFYTENHSLV